MKKSIQIFTILLMGSNFLFATDPNAILFRGSYNAAKQQACKEKKLLLLEFTAKWCQPCRFMEKEVFGNEKVQDFAKDNIIIFKVDIDDSSNKRLVEQYNIEVLPTTILMRASGKILSRKEQSFNPETFISWVTEHKTKLIESFSADKQPIQESQERIQMELPETNEPDHSLLGIENDIDSPAPNELEGFIKSNEELTRLYYIQSETYNNKEVAESAALQWLSKYKMEIKIAEQRMGQNYQYQVHMGLFDTKEEAELLRDVMTKDQFIAVVKSY